MKTKILEYMAAGVAGAALLLIAGIIGLSVLVKRKTVPSQTETIAEAPALSSTETAPARPVLPVPVKAKEKAPPTYVLQLNERNSYVFRGVVTDESTAKALQVIINKSNQLDKNEVFYLVLDTPGGEVLAGMHFIDSLKALPQIVKPVVIFAASMGFQITQNLNERLITPGGTLMSHRMRATLEGQIPGELNSRLAYFQSVGDSLDRTASARMGIDVGLYRQLIVPEYWVSGVNSIKDKAADKMVVMRCGKDLMGTEEMSIATIFGNVKVLFSKCPAITGPLGVSLEGLKVRNQEDIKKVKEYIDTLFNDRVDFVQKYIVTNAYKQIQLN